MSEKGQQQHSQEHTNPEQNTWSRLFAGSLYGATIIFIIVFFWQSITGIG